MTNSLTKNEKLKPPMTKAVYLNEMADSMAVKLREAQVEMSNRLKVEEALRSAGFRLRDITRLKSEAVRRARRMVAYEANRLTSH